MRQGAARQRLRELAAVVPHPMMAAAACRPGGVTDDVTGWRGPGSGDGERVVAEFGQDVADLADARLMATQREISGRWRDRCPGDRMHASRHTYLKVWGDTRSTLILPRLDTGRAKTHRHRVPDKNRWPQS